MRFLTVLIAFLALLAALPADCAHAARIFLTTPHREVTLFSRPARRRHLDFVLKQNRTVSVPVLFGHTGWSVPPMLRLSVTYPARPLLRLDRVDHHQALTISLPRGIDRIGDLEKSKMLLRKYSYEHDHLYVKPHLAGLELGQDWERSHSLKYRLSPRRELLLFVNSFEYWNGVKVQNNPALLKTRLKSASLFVGQTFEKGKWRLTAALGGGIHEIGCKYDLTQQNLEYRSSFTVSTGEMFVKAERAAAGENDYLAFEIRSRTGSNSFTTDPVAHTVTADFDNTYYGVGYNFFFPLLKYIEYFEKGSRKLEKLIF